MNKFENDKYEKELLDERIRATEWYQKYEHEHDKNIVKNVFFGIIAFILLSLYAFTNVAKVEAWENMYRAYQYGYNEGWEDARNGEEFCDEVPEEYDRLD